MFPAYYVEMELINPASQILNSWFVLNLFQEVFMCNLKGSYKLEKEQAELDA